MIRSAVRARRRRAEALSQSTDVDNDWISEGFDDEGGKDGHREATPESSDIPTSSVTSSVTSSWSPEEKKVFEAQLVVLSDELEKALIENQDLKKQLNEEKQRTIQARKNSYKKVNYGSYRGSDLATSTTREGFEQVSSQKSAAKSTPSKGGWWDRVKDRVFEFLYDFTEEGPSQLQEGGEEPLQATKLKDNLRRLGLSSTPWKELAFWLLGVIRWKNPSLTLCSFLVYMYCVWNGWIIQLLLLMAITYLTINYLHVCGVAEQFGFRSNKAEEDSFANLGLLPMIQLIKKVGQMAQNISGQMSDNLEKADNLLHWHQPQATRKIYTSLCTIFAVSLVLSNSYFLTFAGLFLGIKLFIIDNIYRKYPRVKDKYDGLARMWKSLPTKAQLELRQSLTEDQIPLVGEQDETQSLTSRSFSDKTFCERFKLPINEFPLEEWHSGRRCSVLDKDRPLVGSKSGRLYLTHSYLCFERSSRMNDTTDRFTLLLQDITSVSKAKPFAVLPGSGMAIEVILKSGDKPITFSAILHRDQVLQHICDQALILGLSWGSNPEDTDSAPALEDTTGTNN